MKTRSRFVDLSTDLENDSPYHCRSTHFTCARRVQQQLLGAEREAA